jgi:S-adenosyl methyltransferase
LHFIPDSEDPYGIVARLVGALPEGSYLVVSHATNDFLTPQEVAEIVAGRYGSFYARSEAEFTRFLEGCELVSPGIVSVAEWRAEDEPQPRPTAAEAYTYCAVARVNRG